MSKKKVSDLLTGDRVFAMNSGGLQKEAVVTKAHQTHSTKVRSNDGLEGIAWIVAFKVPNGNAPNKEHHVFKHPDDLVKIA
jgi:hypothetical protein